MGVISILFTVLMILSSFICMSTSSWFIFWMGMELGLLSFIPMMFSSNSLMASESAVKYFLIQSLASIIMFGSGAFIFMVLSQSMYMIVMFILSLMMKLGIFPFHFWVIPVVSGMNYIPLMFLLTILKVPPLGLINFFSCLMNKGELMILLLSYLTMLYGSFLGNNLSAPRMVIGASSINHSGWLMMGSLIGSMWIYFLSYSIMLIFTLYSIWSGNDLMSSLMILSLSGLPPFILFLVKFMVILSVFTAGYSIYILFVPILSSVFSLNFYLKLSYSFFMNYKKKVGIQIFINFVFINLLGGLLVIFLF